MCAWHVVQVPSRENGSTGMMGKNVNRVILKLNLYLHNGIINGVWATGSSIIVHFKPKIFSTSCSVTISRGPPWATICLSFMAIIRSEEHTSELQSRGHLVCRLLLEKKI